MPVANFTLQVYKPGKETYLKTILTKVWYIWLIPFSFFIKRGIHLKGKQEFLFFSIISGEKNENLSLGKKLMVWTMTSLAGLL